MSVLLPVKRSLTKEKNTMTKGYYYAYYWILQLPRYTHMIDLQCGFDQEFFQFLKKKFSHKDEMSRHGVLVYDEIQVRKSLTVNLKNMSFDGIGNIDANKKKTSNLADQFQSLGDNYKQPVGVIASESPT